MEFPVLAHKRRFRQSGIKLQYPLSLETCRNVRSLLMALPMTTYTFGFTQFIFFLNFFIAVSADYIRLH